MVVFDKYLDFSYLKPLRGIENRKRTMAYNELRSGHIRILRGDFSEITWIFSRSETTDKC